MVYAGRLCIEQLLRKHRFTFVQAGVSIEWANDSQHLLLENFDAIHHSPSQVYHSALPLSPSTSWVCKCYGKELSGEVKVVKGLPLEWGTCFRTVRFDNTTLSLASWKDIVVVGLGSGEIITLNGTTGSQTAILSGHTGNVRALAFSLDGGLLASGGDDNTIVLWDVQTGGVIKTFHGHNDWVLSVSISADKTTIVSGSDDCTICLWDIQTGGCCHVIEQQDHVEYVNFSPVHSQHLISISGDKVQQWDIDGHQINPPCSGSYATFSLDGTWLALCQGAGVIIQNSGSGAAVAKFCLPDSTASCCCFSPDGRLLAVAAHNYTVYIWDITGSGPHLIETLVGHTSIIIYTVFSSTSLMTLSRDRSVKFWQIGTPSIGTITSHPKPIPIASALIKSITLHAKDGAFISSDSDGVVRTWDISTGLCQTSLQTPAKNSHHSDVRLVNGRLILIWHADGRIHIYDVEKEKPILVIDTVGPDIYDIRLSGDGSNVFCLQHGSIEAWSTWTGEVIGKIQVKICYIYTSLIVSGSRAWVYSPYSLACDEWDLGILDQSFSQLPQTPLLHLSDTKLWDAGLSRIKDTATGKVVLQLGGRFSKPIDVQLDGQYFLARYLFGEVLILDFNHVILW